MASRPRSGTPFTSQEEASDERRDLAVDTSFFDDSEQIPTPNTTISSILGPSEALQSEKQSYQAAQEVVNEKNASATQHKRQREDHILSTDQIPVFTKKSITDPAQSTSSRLLNTLPAISPFNIPVLRNLFTFKAEQNLRFDLSRVPDKTDYSKAAIEDEYDRSRGIYVSGLPPIRFTKASGSPSTMAEEKDEMKLPQTTNPTTAVNAVAELLANPAASPGVLLQQSSAGNPQKVSRSTQDIRSMQVIIDGPEWPASSRRTQRHEGVNTDVGLVQIESPADEEDEIETKVSPKNRTKSTPARVESGTLSEVSTTTSPSIIVRSPSTPHLSALPEPLTVKRNRIPGAHYGTTNPVDTLGDRVKEIVDRINKIEGEVVALQDQVTSRFGSVDQKLDRLLTAVEGAPGPSVYHRTGGARQREVRRPYQEVDKNLKKWYEEARRH